MQLRSAKMSWICLSMVRAVAFYRHDQPAAKRGDGVCHHSGVKITGLLDWVGHICEPVMALGDYPVKRQPSF